MIRDFFSCFCGFLIPTQENKNGEKDKKKI